MNIREKMIMRLMSSTALCSADAGAGDGGAAGGGSGGGTGGAGAGNNPASGVGGAENKGTPTGPAWHPDATPEDMAWYGSKGWDKLDAPSAAKAVTGSYRALEKLVGAEKAGNAVIIPGESADQATKDAFYNRLGRPATVDKYGVDGKSIIGMNETTAKGFLETAHKAGLSTAQVKAMTEWNNNMAKEIQTTLADNAKVELARQVQALKDEWGAAYEKNSQIVNETANRLGLDSKNIQGLKMALGADGAMKLLYKLGEQVGEGRYVGGDSHNRNDGSEGVMTPEQAKLALDKLMKSEEFKKAALNPQHPDHKSMLAKKSQLNAWIVGRDAGRQVVSA